MNSLQRALGGVFIPLTLIFTAASPAAAQAAQPAQSRSNTPASHPAQDLVEQVQTAFIESLIANKDEIRRNPDLVYELLEKEVVPYFDFDSITQFVLGRNARSMTPDQRERFKHEFARTILGQFASTMRNWAKDIEGVDYMPYRETFSREDITRVRTIIERRGSQSDVKLSYDLRRNPQGEWKIFNAEVEGINLGITFRSEYDSYISRHGVEATIAKMKELNDRAGRPPSPTQQQDASVVMPAPTVKL